MLLDFGLTADLESLARPQTVDRQIVGPSATCRPSNRRAKSITAGQRLVQCRRDALRGDDRPAPVHRLARRGLHRQADRCRRLRPIRSWVGFRKTWCVFASALLDRDPARRPTGRDVIACLRGDVPQPADVAETGRPLPLIGRSRHRQVLEGLFDSLGRAHDRVGLCVRPHRDWQDDADSIVSRRR